MEANGKDTPQNVNKKKLVNIFFPLYVINAFAF
jgi:hypothetical protein